MSSLSQALASRTHLPAPGGKGWEGSVSSQLESGFSHLTPCRLGAGCLSHTYLGRGIPSLHPSTSQARWENARLGNKHVTSPSQSDHPFLHMAIGSELST